jgi:hypothetical protein
MRYTCVTTVRAAIATPFQRCIQLILKGLRLIIGASKNNLFTELERE